MDWSLAFMRRRCSYWPRVTWRIIYESDKQCSKERGPPFPQPTTPVPWSIKGEMEQDIPRAFWKPLGNHQGRGIQKASQHFPAWGKASQTWWKKLAHPTYTHMEKPGMAFLQGTMNMLLYHEEWPCWVRNSIGKIKSPLTTAMYQLGLLEWSSLSTLSLREGNNTICAKW